MRLRGWPVPYVDPREPVLRSENWIGQDIDASMVEHYEAWRFFTSGQFNQLRSVSADWRSGAESSPIPSGVDSVIEVWEILFYLTELFELAARLFLTHTTHEEEIKVEVTLNGLLGRGLVVGQRNRAPFVGLYQTSVPSLSNSVSVPRDALVAEPREHAVTMARYFFTRFGWSPPVEQLRGQQQELFDRP